MRVVFMGTPEFAVPSLHAVAERHDVVAVYTRPDAASGRGSRLRPSPVKQAAEQLGLDIRQPRSLRDDDVVAELRALEPDLIVVAAYGVILPESVLAVPRLGCVNVHASLLPRWRGAAPIQRAILAGDELAGVSIMQMEAGLDTGPYCTTASTPIAEKTTDQLTAELARLGAETLVGALPSIENGTCEWRSQDESLVTYAEKIGKADVALSPTLTRSQALARIRASSPQAPSRVSIGDTGATISEAAASDAAVASGAVACTKRALLLGFADGALQVERVKPDGKGYMAGCDWARGARLSDTSTWTEAT